MLESSESPQPSVDPVKAPEAPPDRDALIQALSAERFYINERPMVVRNGLSTDLLCFRSDLLPQNQERLTRMIREAMAYATTFGDVEEMNAIYRLPPLQANFYTALGLYLYFADECSRLKPGTTFLSELRKVRVGLKDGEPYDRHVLLVKFMTALKNLGMDQTHGRILQEWAESGNYTIHGDWNGFDEVDGRTKGAYARLAKFICGKQDYIGMNLPISYALGNKENMEKFRDDAIGAYNFTQGLTTLEGDPYPPHSLYIGECACNGYVLREQRIRDAIRDTFAWQKESASEDYRSTVQHSATLLARGIFGFMPDNMLEILFRRGYRFAYSDFENISKSYPKEPMPSEYLDPDRKFHIREDKGVVEPRYRTVFFSNGIRFRPGDIEASLSLRQMVLAQSLLHEGFHQAMLFLTLREQKPIKERVEKLHQEITTRRTHSDGPLALPDYFNQRQQTIDTDTLAQILDSHENHLYENYDKRKKSGDNDELDTRWLEVACNAYSLLHTEYPRNSEGNNPDRDLPSLAKLSDAMETVVNAALERCRQEYHA